MLEIFKTLTTHVQGMWRFRWYALLVAWPLCLLGWLVVYSMPNVYEANTQVYIDTDSVLKPLLRGLAVETDMTDRVALVTQALVSTPNLEEIARIKEPEFDTLPPLNQQALVAEVAGNVNVGPGKDRNIFQMSYRDADREQALRIVRLLLSNMVRDTISLTRTDTGAAQRFLRRRIEEYEGRLREAEQRLAAFKQQHVGMMPGAGTDYYTNLQGAMAQLETVTDALQLATNRRDELRRQLEGVEPVFGMVPTPAEQVKQATGLDLLIQQYKAELEQLKLQYTDQHPDVVALREIIGQFEARRSASVQAQKGERVDAPLVPAPTLVQQATTIALSTAEIEVSTLAAQIAQLQSRVNELTSSVDTLPEVEAQLINLNRDYNVTRDKHEALIGRLDAARLSEQAEQTDQNIKYRVIEPPAALPKPVSPDRPLLSTVVLAAGLFGGLGMALVLPQIRPVFLSSQMLAEVTGLPVLGAVSLQRALTVRLRHRMELASVALALLLLVGVYGGVVVFHKNGAHAVQALASELREQL